MPGIKPLKCLVLILCLSGTLYSQSTDAEMQQRARETIRVLNEALVRRDRLAEVEGERMGEQRLHKRELDLAQQQLGLQQQRTEFAEERLEFVTREKVPALQRWGLAWRDAYQAAQVPTRRWFCLKLCKRSRKLPPPPISLGPPE